MSYQHGVYTSEVPTSIKPPVTVNGFVPVVVGTAPVNLASSPKVNEPVLCYTYAEAVAALGMSDDFENYTLCEHIYSQFVLFGVAPVVLINVLDPATHKTDVASEAATLADGQVKTSVNGAIISTLVVKDDTATTTYVLNTDYTAAFNDDGELVITRIADGSIPTDTSQLSLQYSHLNPSAVSADDVIGGVDVNGVSTGLELINEVFPRYRLAVTHGLAPKFSTIPAVSAVGKAKMKLVSGNFPAQWLSDIPTYTDGEQFTWYDQFSFGAETVTQYADAAAWKNDNNYTAAHEIVCWPKVALGSRQFHLSTQVACIIGQATSANDGILNVTPSNRSLQADSAVLADGTEVLLQNQQANDALNANGIVTALNWIGGWKAWGNRTAIYPANTDPKDAFIKIRGFQNWLANTLILSYWQNVDGDLNRRQIESITDSNNIFLNGLAAAGQILGGRLEFNPEDNPTTQLLDGKAVFRLFQASPPPNKAIEFIIEYDADYLQTLFS